MGAANESTVPNTPIEPAEERDRLAEIRNVLDRLEITIAEASELAILQDYEVVVIADDSGSMSMASVPPGGKRSFGHNNTRWNELRETLTLTLELATCVAPRVDIFFLNRPSIFNVQDAHDPRLVESFNSQPSGTTPLTETLKSVREHKMNSERPVLVLIATDGEPDGGPMPFKDLVQDMIDESTCNTAFKFQILACTDDDDAVGWLNGFDKQFREVDVTGDYYSERSQILRSGKVTVFKKSDWVMKALLGPICPRFDTLDESNKKHNDLTPFVFFGFIMIFVAYLLEIVYKIVVKGESYNVFFLI